MSALIVSSVLTLYLPIVIPFFNVGCSNTASACSCVNPSPGLPSSFFLVKISKAFSLAVLTTFPSLISSPLIFPNSSLTALTCLEENFKGKSSPFWPLIVELAPLTINSSPLTIPFLTLYLAISLLTPRVPAATNERTCEIFLQSSLFNFVVPSPSFLNVFCVLSSIAIPRPAAAVMILGAYLIIFFTTLFIFTPGIKPNPAKPAFTAAFLTTSPAVIAGSKISATRSVPIAVTPNPAATPVPAPGTNEATMDAVSCAIVAIRIASAVDILPFPLNIFSSDACLR